MRPWIWGYGMRTRLLLLLAAAVYAATVDAASLTFRSPVPVQRSYRTSAVAVADFNGDGRGDLVSLQHGFTTPFLEVAVSLQRSDGSLAEVVLYEIASKNAAGTVSQADLGSDGTWEILIGHSDGLSVLRWNGAGDFSRTDYPATSACLYIATADLDGDGKPDVVCNGEEAGVLFYSALGETLSVPSYMPTAAGGPVRLEDVTGDGKPDLLLASGTANSFFVYSHDGTRGFLPAVAYTYPVEIPWSFSIESLDLDDDQTSEVVVSRPCNIPCAELYVYRKGTHGYLELSQRVPTMDIPFGFLAADIDRDGHEDLFVGHTGWSTVGRYMGRGDGLPSTELWTTVDVQHATSGLAIGDLNHDGYPDLAVVNSFGVSLLYGGRQVPSDIDNDFVSDLVWRNAATGQNQLWIAADSARAHELPIRDSNWALQAISDFDGDSEADLFWRHRTTGANEVNSWRMSTQLTGVADQDWQVVGAGDFDDDGRSDLLWRNSRTGANAIWKSADATKPQTVTSVPDQRWKVAGVGDFDGDGRSDILWRHATTGSNAIWRSGRSELSHAVMGTSVQWNVAGIGDFNGDRKDDIAWRNPSTGANAIWPSANGAIGIAVSTVVDQAWTIAAVGDYNGDRRADLLWRNTSTGANVIWRSGDSRNRQAVTSISGWNVAR